ncbi:MAG: hypothetical protein K0S70_596 [Microbacterium sp.]|jgi:hypothetical protein|nr:hypothetical protein [Microbacterium sp.]
MRRRNAILALTIVFVVSGCATPQTVDPGGAASGSSFTTFPVPDGSDDATESSTPAPSATDGVVQDPDTRQVGEACLRAYESLGPGAADIAASVSSNWDGARSAKRPDGTWYFVVPVTPRDAAETSELQCVLSADLTSATVAATRIAPSLDDFETWSTGQESLEGA